jgi:hypothetical protein
VVGNLVGLRVGLFDGDSEATLFGWVVVGIYVGRIVGFIIIGLFIGNTVGFDVVSKGGVFGAMIGVSVGCIVGVRIGAVDGICVDNTGSKSAADEEEESPEPENDLPTTPATTAPVIASFSCRYQADITTAIIPFTF